MYSRYLPPEEEFLPLPSEEEGPPPPGPERTPPPPRPAQQNRAAPSQGGPLGEMLGGVTQELNRLLGGLFRFSLADLDTGDILLILIVLFLFMEGDDLDLAIALGLTLLLSLGEGDKDPNPPADGGQSRPAE